MKNKDGNCSNCGKIIKGLYSHHPDGAKIKCPNCEAFYIDWGLDGLIFHTPKTIKELECPLCLTVSIYDIKFKNICIYCNIELN